MTPTPFTDCLKDQLSEGELRDLLEISDALHGTVELDAMLGTIISKAKELMQSETVAVILHDPLKDELFFRSTEGNPEEGARRLKEIRFPADTGIAGRVFRSGKAALVPDIAKDPEHFKAVDKQTQFQTSSLVAVPLVARGRPVGVIEACNKTVGTFCEKDLGLLFLISRTVSMAIDNVRTREELQRAYEELKLAGQMKDGWIEDARQENDWLWREVGGLHRFQAIRGNSAEMMEIFRLCDKAINSDITVLIRGETGTGKELVARCLHYNGPRKNGRFVTQNCGGLPESLLSSELFGHKRGAFTGAVMDKKGLFEVAHGGTIFLDEVGEMPAAMQVSLLRVLQEGEIRPLGSTEVRKVNVRVISATSRDLEKDVKNGLFREDLFYRLSVFPVILPALRLREGDIPILANHFVQKFNQITGRKVIGLSDEALSCLNLYPFPGNVRELENEIERAMVLVDDNSRIQYWHLSERISGSMMTGTERVKDKAPDLKTILDRLERGILVRTMEELGGNKTRAAQKLGLSRFGLIKKLKRHGLEQEPHQED
ncbi:MAG: sigma 54-interacting transcriptional regulator [Syntrophobacteraceae bacterium]